MNKHEQTVFIENFLAAMRKTIMDSVQHMPDDWDGIEIRQYIADTFALEPLPMNRTRKRAYLNARNTTCGL